MKIHPILSFLLLFVVLFFLNPRALQYSKNKAHGIYGPSQSQNPLADITDLFTWDEDEHILVFMYDGIVFIITIITIITLILNQSWYLLGQASLTISLLFIFRMITFCSTVLPLRKGGKTVCGLFGGCNDFIFSGHMIFQTLMTFIWIKFLTKNSTLHHIIILLLIINGIIGLLAKCHYTVDVLLSYYITFTLANLLF